MRSQHNPSTSAVCALTMLIALIGFSESVRAQSPTESPCDPIASITADLENPLPTVTVILSSALTDKGVEAAQGRVPTDHVVVKFVKSQKILTGDDFASVFVLSGSGRKEITIEIKNPTGVPGDETEVEVQLLGLIFECQTFPVAKAVKVAPVKAPGELLKEAEARLDDAIATAKSTEEKDIFAGFAVAKGNSEDSEGAADIALNLMSKQLDNAIPFFDRSRLSLRVMKSTAEKEDPRHLSLGLSFTKVFLLHGDLQRYSASIEEARDHGQSRVAVKPGTIKPHLFPSLLLDETLNLEADAFTFDTVNFVSDTSLRLPSIAKALGAKRQGFVNFRLVGGFELGRNLQKPEPPPAESLALDADLGSVNWIARAKMGADLTLRYLPLDRDGGGWGVSLDLGFVNRYLFQNEVRLEDITDADGVKLQRMSVIHGNQEWAQADLKVYLLSDARARYGVKLSYHHGQLPPAYAPTNGFQFGFFVETKDDQSDGAAAGR